MLLELKGLFAAVFEDIDEDSVYLKSTILVIVRDSIVHSEIQRKKKLLLLTPKALAQLSKLYKDTQMLFGMGTVTVRDTVHALLTEICCSIQHGICYPLDVNPDKEIVSPKAPFKSKNPLLLYFLGRLTDYSEDLLLQELVLSILKMCPDIIPEFCKTINFSLDPQLSHKWLASMAFVSKILKLELPSIFTQGLLANGQNRVDLVLPKVITNAALNHGIQHSSPLVVYTMLQVFILLLRRVGTTFKALEAVPGHNLAHQQILKKLKDAGRKRFPDFQTLLTLRHKVFQGVFKESDLLQCGVVSTMEAFYLMIPSMYPAMRVDASKFIPADLDQTSNMVQRAVMSLLSTCAADFRWWEKPKGADSTHLRSLLSLYVSSTHPEITAQCQHLLERLAFTTELFGGFEEEVRVWITTTRRYPGCIGFVEHALCQLMQQPHGYLDSLMLLTARVREHAEGERTTSNDMPPPVSPMVMATCQHAKAIQVEEGQSTAVTFYVCAAFTRILRLQTEPSIVLVAVLQNLSSVHTPEMAAFQVYMRSWLALESPCVAALVPKLDPAVKGIIKSLAAVGSVLPDTNAGSALLPQLLSSALRARFPQRAWCVGCSAMGGLEASSTLRSLFNEPTINEILHNGHARQYAGSVQSAAEALRSLPFEDVFDHCSEFQHLANPAIMAFLHRSLDSLPHSSTGSVCNQLLLCVHSIIGACRNFQAAAPNTTACHAANLAVGSCFELLHHALVLPGGDAVLTATLSHPLLAREFLTAATTPVSTTFNYHVANLVITALGRRQNITEEAVTKILACDVLLTKLVEILNGMVASELVNTGNEIGLHQKSIIPIVSMLVKYIPQGNSADLVTKLLNLSPDALVTATGAAIEGATVTHLGRLLISLVTPNSAAIHDCVSVQAMDKLQALSQQRPCSAIDDAIAAILWTATQDHMQAGNAPRLSHQWVDFAMLANDAYTKFLCKNPTNERSAILRMLLMSNPCSAMSFEAFWAEGTPRMHPSSLGAVGMYLGLVSKTAKYFEPADTSNGWDALCCPIQSVLSRDTTAGCLVAVFDAAIAAYTDGLDMNDTALQNYGGAGVHFYDVLQQLVLLVPVSNTRNHFCNKVFQHITQLAKKDKKIDCSALRLCLSALHTLMQQDAEGGAATTPQAATPTLLLDFLHVLLLVVVEEEDRQTAVFLSGAAPTEMAERRRESTPLMEMLWLTLRHVCIRLSFTLQQQQSPHINCMAVTALALRFEQQVCDHRLTSVNAVNASRQLITTLHVVDDSVRPLDTIYNHMLMAPHLVTDMAHSVEPIDTIDDTTTIDDQRDELLATLESEVDPTHNAHAVHENVRVAVASLLLAIAEAQPAVCAPQHVPTILSLYTASLGAADATLLILLQLYEEHGSNLGHFPCVWGAAVAEQDADALAGTAGQAQRQALESINQRRLMFTIDHIALVPVPPADPAAGIADELLVHNLACYDATFLLPLFHFVLSGEASNTELRRFVECGALSFSLLLLSSADDEERALAYGLVGSFYNRAENSKMRERHQVLIALTSIRNAIVEENQRISPTLTIFVGRAVRIALQPRNELYPIINKFLLQRPLLDLDDVPLFYNLLHSSTPNFRAERIWMLRFLAAGMRTDSDYALFRRRRVFDLVINFYDSELTDPRTRGFILKIVLAAAAVPGATLDLARNRGLLAWLGVCLTRCSNVTDLVDCATILSRLASTLQAHAGSLQNDRATVLKEFRRVVMIHLHALSAMAVTLSGATVVVHVRTTLRRTFATVLWTLRTACVLQQATESADVGSSTASTYSDSDRSTGGIFAHELERIIHLFYSMYGDDGSTVHQNCAALFGATTGSAASAGYTDEAAAALNNILDLVPHVQLSIPATTYFSTTLAEDRRLALIEWAIAVALDGHVAGPGGSRCDTAGTDIGCNAQADVSAAGDEVSSGQRWAEDGRFVAVLLWLQRALLHDTHLAHLYTDMLFLPQQARIRSLILCCTCYASRDSTHDGAREALRLCNSLLLIGVTIQHQRAPQLAGTVKGEDHVCDPTALLRSPGYSQHVDRCVNLQCIA